VVLGLWTESALIFSWQATGLLVFQTLFVLDLAGAVITGRHWLGGTEYMFNTGVPLFVRLLSLFHVLMPPLLLWAIWKLGYDSRGWKLQTLTTWVIVPINYFWRPEHDVNFARGLFFREQHWVPGWLYVTAYLVLVPLLVYFPTHILLSRWTRRIARREPKS
jgi:hypothetical protein